MKTIYILLVVMCIVHTTEAQYDGIIKDFNFKLGELNGYEYGMNSSFRKYPEQSPNSPSQGRGVYTLYQVNNYEAVLRIQYYVHDHTKMSYETSRNKRNRAYLIGTKNSTDIVDPNWDFKGSQDSLEIDGIPFLLYTIIGKDSLGQERLYYMNYEGRLADSVFMIMHYTKVADTHFAAKKAIEASNFHWLPSDEIEKPKPPSEDIFTKLLKNKRKNAKKYEVDPKLAQAFIAQFKPLKQKNYSAKKLQKLTTKKQLATADIVTLLGIKEKEVSKYTYYPLGKVEKAGKPIYYALRVNAKDNTKKAIIAFEEWSKSGKGSPFFICRDLFWPKESIVLEEGGNLKITTTHFIIEEEEYKITPLNNAQRSYLSGYLMMSFR